ncbi:MAG: hypothetical protein IPG23_11735 [Burkholderiales bacterium]|nr:hypothetical protein [Burkholderiales bacterium]
MPATGARCARANVILYPVNLQERPFEAVYVAPELQVLAWVGKPVLAILNQGAGPLGEAPHAERAMEWRNHLSGFPVISGITNLDAYTPVRGAGGVAIQPNRTGIT